jgi:hypothetical protein
LRTKVGDDADSFAFDDRVQHVELILVADARERHAQLGEIGAAR